ncbi:hypothetical protein R3P38DRAFT_2505659 [Favolaschia claudopus]|uniref:Uncharacterized protein n=1 Tax=Favolaschia claudopus TaxID=2862362 RepID=A0AAW0D914_9AGAR
MSEGAASFVPPPPPPGLNYLAAIQPSLTTLMTGTVWSSMLIPLLVVLLLFSTSGMRRKPLFILNLFAVLTGIALGIINVYLGVTEILSPLTVIPGSLVMGYVSMILYLPVYMDTILLVRLFVVYPPHTISWSRRLVVFGPPILFKLIRASVLIVYLVKWTRLVQGHDNPLQAGELLWGSLPYTKIEWFFQVFDNCYASVLFLLRVQKGRGLFTHVKSVGLSSSHASKLRSLFFIALGNFVFPCMLSLVQLIYVFRQPESLNGIYVFLSNCYVEIIGVLMATIWVAGGQWSESASSSSEDPNRISTIRYKEGTQIHIGRSVVQETITGDRALELDGFQAAHGKEGSSEHDGSLN